MSGILKANMLPTEAPLQPPVRPPTAYTLQIAYDYSKNLYYNPNVYVENHESKRDTVESYMTEADSLESIEENEKTEEDFQLQSFKSLCFCVFRTPGSIFEPLRSLS
jgi:hypothetical protein